MRDRAISLKASQENRTCLCTSHALMSGGWCDDGPKHHSLSWREIRRDVLLSYMATSDFLGVLATSTIGHMTCGLLHTVERRSLSWLNSPW